MSSVGAELRNSDFGLIDLTDQQPLLSGAHRLVYQHPDRSDRLVKILRPHLRENNARITKKKRFRIHPREGNYIHFAWELVEYLAVRAMAGDAATDLPMCAIYGLEETTSGIGLIVEKVAEPGGDLSPTLRNILERGAFDQEKRQLLDRFFDEMERHHVVVYELSPDNILYQTDARGRARLVCVDGFGCRTLLPLPIWFKWVNTRNLRVFRRQIEAAIERETSTAA